MIEIVENHIPETEAELDERIIKILTEWGLIGERYAKAKCRVDTGLLRNSITFALDGEKPNTQSYKADRPKEGKEEILSGSYDGVANPENDKNIRSVSLGTNVEYSLYIELRREKSYPFIRPAIEDHLSEYKRIAENTMQKSVG